MTDGPIPDWRLLAPHRPLSPGDDAYVARPTSGGDAIAAWVAAGGSTVLVSGPTGVGKSTELAHAAAALTTRVACLVQVDRASNMHQLTAEALMRTIALHLVRSARHEWKLPISKQIEWAATPPEDDEDDRAANEYFSSSGMSLALAAVAEVARVSKQGRVALLIDGLEKLLPGAATREVFEALSQLPESVDLAVVIPWHAAFGGGTESILRAGEHLHRVAALDTEGAAGLATSQFFAHVLARRLLGTDAVPPEEVEPLLGLAFKSSGGIPRVFLQLMADAGTYARVKRAAPWPDETDLREAIADQQDSFRRALLPGDTKAIKEAVGTDGRELDLERRVRLMAQGILLERVRNGMVVVESHPLVGPALRNARS